MKITATDEQISQMCANAINASMAVGMGFLHYKEGHVFKASEVQVSQPGVFLDYVEGRMVKLTVRRIGMGNTWDLPDSEPTYDYQSWVTKYKTYLDLAASVPGIELV